MEALAIRQALGNLTDSVKEMNRINAVKEMYRCQFISEKEYYEFLVKITGYKKD